jgi:hypothetical protein
MNASLSEFKKEMRCRTGLHAPGILPVEARSGDCRPVQAKRLYDRISRPAKLFCLHLLKHAVLKVKKAPAYFLVSFCCLCWFCTPEEEMITSSGNIHLTFSEDTVSFDTIFTTRGSTTQWLTVRNPNRNAVEVTSIALAGGDSSPYKVYVNGKSGTDFTNQLLLGKDSMLVLVEVTIDPADQNLPFLVKDSLVFNTNGNAQDVKLNAWGQDAHFLQA